VILESHTAQAAFDSALRAGMTVAEAMMVAEPVEAEGRRERYRRAVKLGYARPVSSWYVPQPA
jgi:hypothetical protein